MNILLLDLIGAVGFQVNDTLTTFLGVRVGAVELNSFFKFLSEGKAVDFVLIGIIKVLVAIYIYAITLFNPRYILGLEFDFYLEVGVTLWNILSIYRHKKVR